MRQAIWDTTRRAYDTLTVETLEVCVPPGLSLSRVLGWARRRLRELGVDVAADDRADVQLSEERPERAPGVWVRANPEARLSLHRLDPLQTVAQIRLQVDVTRALAWTLAAATHGVPEVIDGVLAEVIRHPGLVPTDDGLTAGGALPERFSAIQAWTDAVFPTVSDDQRAAIERAALSPPGTVEPDGVSDILLAGPPGHRWLADGVAAAVRNALLDDGRAETLHRAALAEPDCEGFARGWHLLGVGEPEEAEPLLRAALLRPEAIEPLHRCLDLQLVARDDPRRPPDAPAPSADPPPPGPVLTQLEWVLRYGTAEQRDEWVAQALAEREDETSTEIEVLRTFC